MNSKLDSSAQVLYTISEVAELLKVNKNTVYQLIRGGYLRSIKFGCFGCRKVTRKAILDFLDTYDGRELTMEQVESTEGK